MRIVQRVKNWLHDIGENKTPRLKPILLVLVAVFVLIAILPVVLTQNSIIKCFDFTKTGEIGDTIGGIMGPFIAIVAAILTFMAFWVQYTANVQQRNDIARERYENEFFKMLDYYSHISSEMTVNGQNSKAAFQELVGEWTYTFNLVVNAFNALAEDSSLSWPGNTKAKYEELNGDAEKKFFCLERISYGIFFYGIWYKYHDDSDGDIVALAKMIIDRVFSHTTKSINPKYLNFTDYLNRGLTDKIGEINHVGCNLGLGKANLLGHYFRHLYNVVKFVADIDESIFDEKKKYELIKILRAQMSDYEQVLLYKDSLSEFGQSWRARDDSKPFPKNLSYIARFRLIKNMPINYPDFGVRPRTAFADEISILEKQNITFFENSNRRHHRTNSI